MLNVSFLVGTYIIVSPCPKGSCRSLSLSSGLFGGSIVSDTPPKSQHAGGDCPENSPKATARIKAIEIL